MLKKKKVVKNVIIKLKQSNNEMKNDYNENANSLMFTYVDTRRNIDDNVDTFVEWIYKSNVEIVWKKSSNASIYEWHDKTIDENEKTKILNIRQHKRDDEKHNDQ